MATWNVRLRGWAVAVGRALRDAWLIVGIVFGGALLLEALYRAQGAVRRIGRHSTVEAQESTAPWMRDYVAEERRSQSLEWRPYVYFRRTPFAGKFITVDSTNRRVTVQPAAAGAPEVFIFGGSTLFGTFQRDDATIPSVLGRELREHFALPAHITNFGETGYVFTQEVLELLLQLRGGATPKVVIFYDGINDAAAAVQDGQPGLPLNEAHRARDFRFGRAVFAWETDVPSQARAMGYLALAAAQRFELMRRMQRARAAAPLPPVARLTDSLIATYARTVRLVDALGAAQGFTPIYVWQPTLHATHKALTAGERDFRNLLDANEQQRYLRELHDSVAARIDAAVRPVAGARFLNLARVFDTVAAPVFADDIGHTYEEANPILVRALAPTVAQALRGGRPRQGM